MPARINASGAFMMIIALGLSSSARTQNSPGVLTITNYVHGEPLSLAVDTSQSAGAIRSVTYRGVQYVDTFDHGRFIQSAVTLDDLGECLNPTEAGSSADKNGTHTSSKLLRGTATATTIETTTNAAYWLTPGEPYGQRCGSGTSLRQAQNRVALSSTNISRTLSFYSRSIPNLVRSEVVFEIPEGRTEGTFEGLTGYLPGDFDIFLSYDLYTRALKPLTWTRLERLTTEPIIVTRPDGTASLGVVSPMIEKDGPQRSFYGYFYSPGPGPTAKWACIFERVDVPARTRQSFECDFAVGSVDEVIEALNGFASSTGHLSANTPVFGFYRGAKHFYALSYTEGARAGLSFNGTAFHVDRARSTGGVALYRCYASSDDDHYASLRQNCDGHRNGGQLGYIQLEQVTGLVPLYLFYKLASRTHLVTVDYAEGALNGYALAEKLGYVRP